MKNKITPVISQSLGNLGQPSAWLRPWLGKIKAGFTPEAQAPEQK